MILSSSYTATGAGCYSGLPSSAFTPTAGCQRILPGSDVSNVSGTWTMGGETITGLLLAITGTIPISTSTTSFAPTEATTLAGAAVNDMFILVHQASDTASTASTASSPSKTNAAVRMRGNKNELGIVAIVYYLALALRTLLV